jgi:ABC-type multidrug transport system ATPase subunit
MDLHITSLSKTYPNGVAALSDVSLTIERGLFGLLGPNGAGKSTLMRILATLQSADRGSVQLHDGDRFIDVLRSRHEVRSLLGYLPQDFGVYPKMSAATLLNHLAELKGVSRSAERSAMVEALLVKTNLWEQRSKPLGTFSGGMRQRFGIAQALIGRPRLLIVDEPTAGLDPEERVRFHNLLAEIAEQVIVLLSTHIVADVADLCPKLAILHQGQVLVSGAPLEISRRLADRVFAIAAERSEVAELSAEHEVISSRLIAGKTVLHVIAEHSPGPGFYPVEASLEDAYFAAIGQLLPDAADSPMPALV